MTEGPLGATVWSDNIPLGPLQEALKTASPTYDEDQKKYWRGAPLPYTAATEEVVEIQYNTVKLFNSVSFSLATVPQYTKFEYFNQYLNEWIPIHDYLPPVRVVTIIEGKEVITTIPGETFYISGETEDQRLDRITSQVWSGGRTLDNVRASVDRLAYNNDWMHFEPLPTNPAQDAPHLTDPTNIRARVRAIFNNRGVTISTAVYETTGETHIVTRLPPTQEVTFNEFPWWWVPGRSSPGTYPVVETTIRDFLPGQWTTFTHHKCHPFMTKRIRAVMKRLEPVDLRFKESAFSLAVKDLDLGWKITEKTDIIDAQDADWGIGQDLIGGKTQAFGRNQVARNVLTEGPHAWRSEPMPTREAVVNFYLDCRNPDGSANIIDRVYLDPLYEGPNLTVYIADTAPDVPNFDPKHPEGYTTIVWKAVPRNYRLTKGFLHLPPQPVTFMKLEFTNLIAEPYETYFPIRRTVQLFETEIVTRHRELNDVQVGTGAPNPTGVKTAIISPDRFVDQVRLNLDFSIYADDATITSVFEALGAATAMRYIESPTLRHIIQERILQLQPKAVPASAPRFVERSVHTYQQIDLEQTSKVGFFVGLKKIEPFRVRYVADDNTPVYVEHFHDLENVAENSFSFVPNMLSMAQGQTTAVLRSNVFPSTREVTAVQFATHATQPAQLLPDSGADDPTQWFPFGNVTLDKDPTLDSSVRVTRVSGTLGGITSNNVSVVGGRVHAAARVYTKKALAGPLYLRIVNSDGYVLTEVPFAAKAGGSVEIVASALTTASPVTVNMGVTSGGLRAAVISKTAGDSFSLKDLSLFEEGLRWEFTNNGGSSWFPAWDIANNPNGVLTFPDPGTNLGYRVTALKPDQRISYVTIRPWYAGLLSGIAPQQGYVRGGPNVNPRDDYPEIENDPNFYSWARPVPRSWFDAAKQHRQRIVQS